MVGVLSLVIIFLLMSAWAFLEAGNDPIRCVPTPPQGLGPFYKPGAPERSTVGQGYVLKGIVRSSRDCAPLPGARVEFWLAGPSGNYDDDHRATVFSDEQGAYRFQSNPPPAYGRRPPHIHIRVTAHGFKTLVTQHYLTEGKDTAKFDLILIPE